jgi:hypothetical protein
MVGLPVPPVKQKCELRRATVKADMIKMMTAQRTLGPDKISCHILLSTVTKFSQKIIHRWEASVGSDDADPEAKMGRPARILDCGDDERVTDARSLNRHQAAAYCGCDSLSTFADWVRRGIVPGPIPGTHRWDRRAIDAALGDQG